MYCAPLMVNWAHHNYIFLPSFLGVLALRPVLSILSGLLDMYRGFIALSTEPTDNIRNFPRQGSVPLTVTLAFTSLALRDSSVSYAAVVFLSSSCYTQPIFPVLLSCFKKCQSCFGLGSYPLCWYCQTFWKLIPSSASVRQSGEESIPEEPPVITVGMFS